MHVLMYITCMLADRNNYIIISIQLCLLYIIGFGSSVPQGAVTTINCAVNPTLNSQQAVYYSVGSPKQPSATARS